MRSVLGTAALLVTVAVSVAAQQPLLGTVTTSHASGNGSVSFAGDLEALWADWASMTDASTAPWILEARHIDATIETVEATAYAASTTTRTDPESESKPRMLESSTITIKNGQADAYVFVAGRGAPVEVRGIDVALQAVGTGAITEEGKYPDQQVPLQVEWPQAVGVTSQQASIEVTGDFLVAVWGLDLDIQHAKGREQWQTGRHNEQRLDPDGNAAVADEAWVYLDVRDGALMIPRTAIPAGGLFAGGDANLYVEGSLETRNAQGQLLGHALDAQDVTVEGSLWLPEIRVHEDRSLTFQVLGDADSLILGDQSVALEPHAGSASQLWGLLLVAVLTVAAWRWSRPLLIHRRSEVDSAWRPKTLRQRRGVGYAVLARNRLTDSRPRRARRHAKRSLRLYPGLPEGFLARGISWFKLGDMERALRDLEAAWRHLVNPNRRAVAGLFAAQACMLVQDWAAARQWVIDAYNVAPRVVTDEVRRPAFDAMDQDSFVQSLRRNPGRAARQAPGFIDPSIV